VIAAPNPSIVWKVWPESTVIMDPLGSGASAKVGAGPVLNSWV
jgi:hypothetical protein